MEIFTHEFFEVLFNRFLILRGGCDNFCILNQVQDPEVEDYLREKLIQHGIEPIGAVYREDTISLSWLKGLPIEKTRANKEIGNVIAKFEQFEKEGAVI